MEQSKRQKQVGNLIQEEISSIFLKQGMNMVDGGMVSVSYVLMTPDLLEARIYISLFQVKNNNQLMSDIRDRVGEWRNLLGQRVRNQLRRVPELQFFEDETLDHVFKMEVLFKKLAVEKAEREAAMKKPTDQTEDTTEA